MSTPNLELEKAILEWISTFQDLTHKAENFSSLAEGITLVEIMNKIDPSDFDLSKVNLEISDNWALRLSNLSFLFERLEHYYTSVLNKFFDKGSINLVKISQNDENKEDLYNLVQLVLGAALQCPDKEHYINGILALDESSQSALMNFIEKIISKSNLDNSLTEHEGISMENIIGRNSHVAKADILDKNLLGKLEELENETQALNKKLHDADLEKEELRTRVSELLAELDRKNVEMGQIIREREEIQEKLTTQETIEDMKNELKLKDRKYEQLEGFVEELKSKNEDNVSRLEAEIDKQKRRVADLTKVEVSLDYYKQKCEEYAGMNNKFAEMEEEAENYQKKIEEANRTNEALQSKMNTFKEKLEAEKTMNISLDIELTKKKTEIETLKSEKRRIEAANNDLDAKVLELNKQIAQYARDQENANSGSRSTTRAISQLTGEGFMDDDSTGKKESLTAGRNEGEKEILEQENNILKTKCKEIQIEHENLKTQMEQILSENQGLKEEKEKLLKQVETEKKQAVELQKKAQNGDQEVMKEMIEQKTELISQLNEEIVLLKENSQKVKQYEEEIKRKENELSEKNEELEAMKSIVTEIGDQKEEEMKILAAAVGELSLRNLELERQITSLENGAGQVPKISIKTQVAQQAK